MLLLTVTISLRHKHSISYKCECEIIVILKIHCCRHLPLFTLCALGFVCSRCRYFLFLFLHFEVMKVDDSPVGVSLTWLSAVQCDVVLYFHFAFDLFCPFGYDFIWYLVFWF